MVISRVLRQLRSTGRNAIGVGQTSSSTVSGVISTPSAALAPIALMIDAASCTGRPHRISSGTWQVSHMPMLYAHGGALRSARLPETGQPYSPAGGGTQVK